MRARPLMIDTRFVVADVFSAAPLLCAARRVRARYAAEEARAAFTML